MTAHATTGMVTNRAKRKYSTTALNTTSGMAEEMHDP
jgi:hypothetical protein